MTNRFARAAGCALIVLLCACQTTLESGLEEAQANNVLALLHSRNIGAQKEPEQGLGNAGRFRVQVSSDDVGRALQTLQESGVPARSDPGLFDVFGEGGLVPTAVEERARYVAALGSELADTIQTIDGVVGARVHIALPHSTANLDESTPATPRASVLIRRRAGAKPYHDDEIRSLVAGAVVGMQPSDVAIVSKTSASPLGKRARLVHLGPIAVTAGTAMAAKAVLGAAFLALLVMAGLLLVFLIPRRLRTS